MTEYEQFWSIFLAWLSEYVIVILMGSVIYELAYDHPGQQPLLGFRPWARDVITYPEWQQM